MGGRVRQKRAARDESDLYPFAGYKDVLNTVYCAVRERESASVLDLGFGTGVLTARLYADGYAITGVDFSANMIALAKEKIPDACLLQADLTHGLPPELSAAQYDFIISTYAMHHFTDAQKEALWRELLGHLKPGGAFIIGDVAFATQAEQDACHAACGDEWDDEESYIVAERFCAAFPNMQFVKLSHCAGVLTLRKPDLR